MTERIPFENVLLELQGILGPKYSDLVDPGKKIATLKKQDYQSPDFVRAGFSQEAGRGNESDRHVFSLEFDDKTQLFIITGKAKSENPYELIFRGADLRETRTVTYSYDGVGTIVEFDFKSGGSETHTGPNGSLDTLLPWLQKFGGRLVKTETLTP